MSSALPGFYRKSIEERQNTLRRLFGLTEEELRLIKSSESSLTLEMANTVIENCVAMHSIPIGVATNFIVDGKEIIVPMANEEPSVIAGASNAAKLARNGGGFVTSCGPNICGGQAVLIPNEGDLDPLSEVERIRDDIINVANDTMPSMVSRDGGVTDLIIRQVNTDSKLMIVIEINVNVCEAMGANCVNKACEAVLAFVARILGYTPLMGIITNLAKDRLVYAKARWPIAELKSKEYEGPDVAQRIVYANDFARADIFRAATHRKGIMNGVTSVVLSTGNDTRAVESAVHSYATYSSNPCLTRYYIDGDCLVGEIELPIPVGVVGGTMRRDPSIEVMRKLLRVNNADELARTIAAVGLASNFAAIRALVTTGICHGHMRLHSHNIALEAGARGPQLAQVAQQLVQSGDITMSHARRILSMSALDQYK